MLRYVHQWVITYFRTNDVPTAQEHAPKIALYGQLMRQLHKVAFKNPTPYITSMATLCAEHAQDAAADGTKLNLRGDNSPVEAADDENKTGLNYHGGGRRQASAGARTEEGEGETSSAEAQAEAERKARSFVVMALRAGIRRDMSEHSPRTSGAAHAYEQLRRDCSRLLFDTPPARSVDRMGSLIAASAAELAGPLVAAFMEELLKAQQQHRRSRAHSMLDQWASTRMEADAGASDVVLDDEDAPKGQQLWDKLGLPSRYTRVVGGQDNGDSGPARYVRRAVAEGDDDDADDADNAGDQGEGEGEGEDADEAAAAAAAPAQEQELGQQGEAAGEAAA
jgi:hypothetical protein